MENFSKFLLIELILINSEIRILIHIKWIKKGLIVSRSNKDTKYSVFVGQEEEKIGDIFLKLGEVFIPK